MQKFRHIIFDWSGTLYDDHGPSYLSTREVILELTGKKISFADYKKYFCLPVTPFYRRYGVTWPIDKINDYYFSAYNRFFNQGELYAGVREALELLKKNGITTSVFSTLRQDFLTELCHILKIQKYFKFIHGSVCDKVKEMPAHLKELSLKASNEILFIGDMDHDVNAANAGKLTSGCMLNGYHDEDKLLKAHPRFVWRQQNDWLPFFAKPKKFKVKKKSRDYPVATAGALVFNKRGEVLLVLTHKWSHTYGIPGGKIEKGEDSVAALKREIREETALKISDIKFVMVQDCIDSKEFYVPKSHFLLFNYTAKTTQSEVRLNNEALSYLWIEPKLALNLKLNEPTRALIETICNAHGNLI